MSDEWCPGVWVRGKNQCPCPRCRRIEEARSEYISANERVHRLHNQGADPIQIARAEIARERLAEQWQEAAS